MAATLIPPIAQSGPVTGTELEPGATHPAHAWQCAPGPDPGGRRPGGDAARAAADVNQEGMVVVGQVGPTQVVQRSLAAGLTRPPGAPSDLVVRE